MFYIAKDVTTEVRVKGHRSELELPYTAERHTGRLTVITADFHGPDTGLADWNENAIGFDQTAGEWHSIVLQYYRCSIESESSDIA